MSQAHHLAALAALSRGSAIGMAEALDGSESAVRSFPQFLTHHQLLAYTAHILETDPHSTTLQSMLPDSFLQEIDNHCRKLSRKNDRLEENIGVLSRELEAADIPFILLKGAHLALSFYGGVERRTFWDMDILVRQEDIEPTHRVLSTLGYARISTPFINDRVSRHFGHSYDYRRYASLDVDLHWKLTNQPGIDFNYPAIWREKQLLRCGGTEFFALSDEIALAFLLVGIVKDIERGALRLRGLLDLYLVLVKLDGVLDWSAFFENRKNEGTDLLCCAVLALFLSTFSVQENEFPELLEALAKSAVVIPPQEEARALLQPSRYAVNNKRWVAAHYPISRMAYYAWWAYSLPARLVLHGSAKRLRQKNKRKTTR